MLEERVSGVYHSFSASDRKTRLRNDIIYEDIIFVIHFRQGEKSHSGIPAIPIHSHPFAAIPGHSHPFGMDANEIFSPGAKQLNNSSSDQFSTIDQWETSTIEIVKRTAERARDQLVQLFNKEKELLKKQSDSLTEEIRRRQEDDEFAENDIRQLQEKISRLQQSFKQLAQSTNINVIASQIGQVDWNRLISVEKQQERSKYE